MKWSFGIRTVAVALTVVAGSATSTLAQDVPSSTPEQVVSGRRGEIPVGQELDIRLQTRLDSDTAQIEDRFEASTVVDVMQDGRVLIPAGSTVRGLVRDVDRASRTDRTGELTLSFDEILVNGDRYPIRANATEVVKSSGLKGESGKIAAGAGVGAIVGGIIGGVEGALTGLLIGAGGTIAATEGNDVELEPGTVIRIRLDQPLRIDRY